MEIHQRREELQRRVSELRALKDSALPARVTVHLGLDVFAEVNRADAEALLAKRLAAAEKAHASLCQLAGVNEEGLPVFEIVEELDDDDNVVSAKVNHAGWPLAQQQEPASTPNPTADAGSLAAQGPAGARHDVGRENTGSTAVADNTAEANNNNTAGGSSDARGEPPSASAAAVVDGTVALETSDAAAESGAPEPDAADHMQACATDPAEPEPQATTRAAETETREPIIAQADDSKEPRTSKVRVLEDASLGEFRDIDTSDILELELVESDVEYDFDDIEEESDEEERYSLFPESTLKLIEAHLGRVQLNAGDDVESGASKSTAVQSEAVQKPLEASSEAVEVPPGAPSESVEASSTAPLEKPAKPSSEKPSDVPSEIPPEAPSETPSSQPEAPSDAALSSPAPSDELEGKTDAGTAAEPGAGLKSAGGAPDPQSDLASAASDSRSSQSGAASAPSAVQSVKKGVRFSENVDIKEYEINRLEHKQMPKVSKFKQARALETRNQPLAAAVAAMAASRNQTKLSTGGLSGSRPALKPIIKKPSPRQLEKDTEQFLKDSFIPDEDFLALHDVEPTETPDATSAAARGNTSSLARGGSRHKRSGSRPTNAAAPASAAPRASSPAGSPTKPAPIVAEQVVEREEPATAAAADFSDMAEVRARYQQLKQRLVYANGSYVSRPQPVEPLQTRKVSRFKAARP